MTSKPSAAKGEDDSVGSATDLNAILARIGEQRYPPVDKWEPELCGEIDMEIRRDGTWLYRGSPIGRQAMVKLFASVLRRDAEDGPYFLVTPVEKLELEVDVAPLIAVELRSEGEGREQVIGFRTNVDDYVVLDEAHPLRIEKDRRNGEALPLIRVRGRIDALLSRPVYYQLVELAEPAEDGDVLGVWSSGRFFPIGRADG